MIRTLSMLVRRPDITRKEFRDHYEEVHAPLALPLVKGLIHYVRNHIVETLGGEEPCFDTLSEFGYSGSDVLEQNIEMLSSERGADLRADELTFMDKARNHFFEVQVAKELPVRGEPLMGGVKIALLARARANQERQGFLADYRRSLSSLLEPAACWWHWVARPFGDVVPRADVATLAWFRPEVFDAGAVRAWKPEALSTCRLLVEECVTRRAEP